MPPPTPSRRRRPWLPAVIAGLLACGAAVAAVLLLGNSSSSPRTVRRFESIFQDDQLLLDSPTPAVRRALTTLRALGVDRLRVTVLWLGIAPDGGATQRPRGFRASDPSAYPVAGWAPYDRLVRLAAAGRLAVDFNVTAPGPLWAMFHPAPSIRLATHYRPSASAYGAFVAAVGKRYSGSFQPPSGHRRASAPLPRVSFWTIWNEPNQPGWLAPQWRTVAGMKVLDSPRLYRAYVDAGFAALERTGHGPETDTVLIGELAPEGTEAQTDEAPVPPMPFIRALYCVDESYKPLHGPAAAPLHCPAGGSPSRFVSAHPGLFAVSGFAHHPYSFFLPPDARMSDPNFVPLSDLARLENGLDRIFSSYGIHRTLPIWLTEYGYETDPPNPFRGISPVRQSRYLNEAQYMAWKDPRVRSLAQFLLVDSAPNRSFRPGSVRYWSTFQTGLEYLDGRPKPALASYRLPIFVPDQIFRPGSSLLLWAMLRLAPNYTSQRAEVQWRPPRGGFRTIASVQTSDPSGFLTAKVRLPGSGAVRIVWRSPAGMSVHSRIVVVHQA